MSAKSICFIGLDGSGKSTAVNFALDWCKNNNVDAQIVRAAYVIEKSNKLIKLGKKITMRKHSDPYKQGDYANYLAKMRNTNTKSLKYRVFSFITTREFKKQIKDRIVKNLKIGHNLLIDRYIYDNAVTYAANLGLGKEYISEVLSNKWKKAPIPTRVIYVKTPIDICMSRKDDVPDKLYLEIREPLYDIIADMCNAVVVDGSVEINKMKAKIEDICRGVFNG